MPEAVIVSAVRSPIGRAMKGSLKTIRPDDLTTQMVAAALAKVPELDPTEIDDLLLGCGQPAGQSGFNIARVVAVELGYDFLPGVTVNRYCSSSLQTTRMALHAIKAGEGDVFVSAGVESVSSFVTGNADGLPNTKNPRFADAEARTAKLAEGGVAWTDPRGDEQIPDVYIAMGQTAENVASATGITREEQDRWVSAPRTARRKRSRTASSSGRSPRSPSPTAPSSAPTTAPAPAPPTRASASSSPCSARTAPSPPATRARSTTAPPRSSSCPTPRPRPSA